MEILDESLNKRHTRIYCYGLLEQVIYKNVADNVWLPFTAPFSCFPLEMTTEKVFSNVQRLQKEGFEIEVEKVD